MNRVEGGWIPNYTTDGGGNLLQCVDGNITSTLSGRFSNIFDNCGAISRTSTGNIQILAR